jgi:hypothetical protein
MSIDCDYPIGTVLKYQAFQGWSEWAVTAAFGEHRVLRLINTNAHTEIRPIGHEVSTYVDRIQSHVAGKFVLEVTLPSSDFEVLT